MPRTIFAIALTFLLCGCNSSPGPLEGSWKAMGPMPITASFRAGEVETQGVIEKVSYEVKGQSVIVTMKDGMAKGTAIRYVLTSPDTMEAMGLTYRKVGR